MKYELMALAMLAMAISPTLACSNDCGSTTIPMWSFPVAHPIPIQDISVTFGSVIPRTVPIENIVIVPRTIVPRTVPIQTINFPR